VAKKYPVALSVDTDRRRECDALNTVCFIDLISTVTNMKYIVSNGERGGGDPSEHLVHMGSALSFLNIKKMYLCFKKLSYLFREYIYMLRILVRSFGKSCIVF
jgi:hypothetical protein